MSGDVSQLFTFGTPHQGVPEELFWHSSPTVSVLVDFAALYQPAVCDPLSLVCGFSTETIQTGVTG